MIVDHSTYPKTADEARAAGSAYYFTGLPCAHGHVAPRRAHNGTCAECQRQMDKRRRARLWAEARPQREADAERRRADRKAAQPTGEWKRLTERAKRQARLREKLREVGTEVYYSAQAKRARDAYWADPEKHRARRRDRGRRGLAGHRLHVLRTPPWQSDEEREAIKRFYATTPPGHEVDHVIPFVGRRLAGLHVLANLAYRRPRANKEKINHWMGTEEDMLDAIRAGLAVFPFDVSETGEIDWEKYRDV